MHRLRAHGKWLMGSFALLLFLGACNRGGQVGSAAKPAIAPGAPAEDLRQEGDADGTFANEVQTDEAAALGLGASDLAADDRVIKTADLRIEVGDGEFQDKFSRAEQVAERFGGFISSSSVFEGEKGEITSGDVAMRIPAADFQAAIAELKKLGRVVQEGQSGRDVSQEFVDLEARLRHAQASEAFYLRLIDRAEAISELIQIQQQLSQVQLEIERIKGTLSFLEEQTSFSTVTVSMFEEGAGPKAPPGSFARAWEDAVEGFKSVVAGLIVVLGNLAPFVLIAAVAVALWRVLRRARRKTRAASSG